MSKGLASVSEFYEKTQELLKLEPVSKRTGFTKKIVHAYGDKSLENIEVWGEKDFQKVKKLDAAEKKKFVQKKITPAVICIILTDGLLPFPELEREAEKRRIALLVSGLSRKKCLEGIKKVIPMLFPEWRIISGGLLQIYGLGVLIVGDSGIGKSECALELISRGFKFVSDDVTQIRKQKGGKLLGSAPRQSRDFMEIRGLGIINIKEIFGTKATCRENEINLVIQLKRWELGKEYDRLGLKFAKAYEIQDKKVPLISIPVAPGRNMATLVEVACKVHLLKQKGYHAPQEIIKKMNQALPNQS